MKRGERDIFGTPCGFGLDDDLCGLPGDFHLLFEQPRDGEVTIPGVACINHIDVARQLGVWMEHPIMPNCQMPGSAWDIERNECIVPQDFLQHVASEARVSVLLEAGGGS
jgi:hypothetical protein